MSQAPLSNHTTLKVNRAISGATTVGASCYAIITYKYSSFSAVVGASYPKSIDLTINRYFGPGQSIQSTIPINNVGTPGGYGTATYTLMSGVEFINSN